MFATFPTNRLEKNLGFSTSYPPEYSTRSRINGNGASDSSSVPSSNCSLLFCRQTSFAFSIMSSTCMIKKFNTSFLFELVALNPIAKGKV